MKIRSVDATWLRVPIPEGRQHTSDFGRMRSFDTVLVRVETDSGLVGHGEAKAGVGNLGDGRALVTLIRDELGETTDWTGRCPHRWPLGGNVQRQSDPFRC